jgi:hypothetical protein
MHAAASVQQHRRGAARLNRDDALTTTTLGFGAVYAEARKTTKLDRRGVTRKVGS